MLRHHGLQLGSRAEGCSRGCLLPAPARSGAVYPPKHQVLLRLDGQQARSNVIALASRSFKAGGRKRRVVTETEEEEEQEEQQQQQQVQQQEQQQPQQQGGQQQQQQVQQQQQQQAEPKRKQQSAKQSSSSKSSGGLPFSMPSLPTSISLPPQLQQLQQTLTGEKPASTQKPAAPPASQAAASEATVTAGGKAANVRAEPQTEYDEIVVTEEEVVYVKPFSFQSAAEDTKAFLTTTNPGKVTLVAAGALVAGSFLLACWRYWQKFQSAQAKRQRQVNRNKALVQELSKVIPGDRSKLTSGFVKGVRLRTGYTMVELFRKYLWYLLRERKFDQGAVDDLVALKHAAGLTDQDVAEALRERAQRVYDKYGTLMLNTEGMTTAGVERKAACQALFRKLLYLTEHEPLIKQGGEPAKSVDLKRIFGATEEDAARLRIVSLYDVDLEKAFEISASDDDEAQSSPSAGAIDAESTPTDNNSSNKKDS